MLTRPQVYAAVLQALLEWPIKAPLNSKEEPDMNLRETSCKWERPYLESLQRQRVV